MTLSFTQKINGKANYFIEKIWQCLKEQGLPLVTHVQYLHYLDNYKIKFGTGWDGRMNNIELKPKRHTIRAIRRTKTGEVSKKQWKAGDKAHPCINNRSPHYFQFAPAFPIIAVQYIEIYQPEDHSWLSPSVNIGNDKESCMPFYFKSKAGDGIVTYGEDQMKQLAINDGFESMEDFFEYFNTNFEGYLLHFTDLKY